ncbi:MAG: peptidyl-dipeptidase [Parachlamydiales bacterium]|nr:peptidyl-dipeptidase [Parachlamydiales bacterium]
MKSHPFSSFLAEFIPQIEMKSRQLNQAAWILETTGSPDAADLKAALDTELKLLFHDPSVYRQLVLWDHDKALTDPILKRQLNILIRAFAQNQIPKELVAEIAQKEANLSQTYANFRPQLDGRSLSENDIRDILKNENDPAVRKKAWEASKQIGVALAAPILDLVELRNRAARSLQYDDLASQQKRFSTSKTGPWAWSDPFCQEDPLDSRELDQLVDHVDIPAACRSFYRQMGFDVQPILDRSDMFERNGKRWLWWRGGRPTGARRCWISLVENPWN